MPRRRVSRVASCAGRSSARITPRLPESIVGLTTHGNRVAAAMTAGSSDKCHSLKAGDGTPAAANRQRMMCLSRAASAASGALWASPRHLAGPRRQQRAGIVHPEDGGHGNAPREFHHRFRGAHQVAVVEGEVQRRRAAHHG